MSLTVTTAPTELPVSLDEVKEHLRVTDNSEDGYIAGVMRAVVAMLDGPEGLLHRCLVTQTLQMTMDCFPATAFDLPLPPMQSVTSIQYIDTNGDTQTLASSGYRVLNANTPTKTGRIELAYGESWPSVRTVEQAVTVTFVAGYGARNAVPATTRFLILSACKLLYDYREPVVVKEMVMGPAYAALWGQAQFAVVH